MEAVKKIYVEPGQNIWDIAQQEYGTPEGVILVLQANPGVEISQELKAGTELIIWPKSSAEIVMEIIKTEPYASSLQTLLRQWASLIFTPALGGGTTTEISGGFGINISNFIASLHLDDLNLSPNIRPDDLILFIYVDESGTSRYRKIALRDILAMVEVTGYLRNLSDVGVAEAAAGDLLKFDGEKWVNDPVLGIAQLQQLTTINPLLYYNNSIGRFDWLELGAGLQIVDGKLTSSAAEQLWKRVGSVLYPATDNDSIDLGQGGINANNIDAKGLYSAAGVPGITGQATILTGCSYDSETNSLRFTRALITINAGIVTGVTAASNLNVNI